MTSSSASRHSQRPFLAALWRVLGDPGTSLAAASTGSHLQRPLLQEDTLRQGEGRLAHGGEGPCPDAGIAEPILPPSFAALAPSSDLGAQAVHEGFADPCAERAPMGATHAGTAAGGPQGVRGASPSIRGTPGDTSEWRPSKAPLGRFVVLGYGTGHVLNDLTSACWFTYLLIFLTDIGLSPQ